MKKLQKYFLTLILTAVVSFGCLFAYAPQLYGAGSNAKLTDTMRGMFVYTYNNRDFPSKKNLSSKQLKKEITEIVEFAKKCGYNTIYFEAVPSADAMYQSKIYPTSGFWLKNQGDISFTDPLQILIDEAEKHSIDVYAMINPYLAGDKNSSLSKKNIAVKNPKYTFDYADTTYLNPAIPEVNALIASIASEIVKKYSVAGVALVGLDTPIISENPNFVSSTNELIKKVSDDINELDPNTKFGLILNSSIKGLDENVTQWCDDNIIDFLVSNIGVTTSSEKLNYKAALDDAKKLISNSNVKVYTGNYASRINTVSSDGEYFDDVNEINYQLFINYQNNVDGFVIDNYKSLKNNFYSISENIMTLVSTSTSLYPDTNLTIPTKFAVTRPASELNTKFDTYFITGTSNPQLPVYLDKAIIPSDKNKGTFGIIVDVKDGKNEYIISQDGKEIPVIINKTTPDKDPVIAIKDIVPLSVSPQVSSALKVLDEITVSCVAPLGGKVTATLDGTATELIPAASKAENGTPVIYSATVKVPDIYAKNKTTNLGKVTYALTYDGKITTRKSLGNVYVSGADASLAITVTDYIAGVYLDPKKEGEFLTTLKNGTEDYVTEQTNTHYKLKSGGYIKKTATDIIEGVAEIDNHVSDFIYNVGDKSESLVISGTGKAPFIADMQDDALIITFFNTDITAKMPAMESNLFSNISVTIIDETTCSFRFSLKPNAKIWGYNVEYSENNTIIYFKEKPSLSYTFGKPLENVSVVLDPGHGGKDPGAIGAGGINAPMEAQINFAVSYAIKHRLEQMGATVQLTRYDDSFVALNDRMRISEQMKPDFFIAIHHNSVGENSDANKAFGTEVYYNESGSKQLAERLEENISYTNGRTNRGFFEDYYLVTRMTYTPSVLVELGFLPNPIEYADITDSFSMYKTSCAVSRSIMECLAEPKSK